MTFTDKNLILITISFCLLVSLSSLPFLNNQNTSLEQQLKEIIVENHGISSNIDNYFIVNLAFYGIVNNSNSIIKTQEAINSKIPSLVTRELRISKVTPKLNDEGKGLLFGIEVTDKDQLKVNIILCNSLIFRYYFNYIDYLSNRVKTKTCDITGGCNDYDKESSLNINTVFIMVKVYMKPEDSQTLLLLNGSIDNITKEIDIVNLTDLLKRLKELLELEAYKPSPTNQEECMNQIKQVYFPEEEMIKISILKEKIPEIIKNSIEVDPLDINDVK